MRYSALSLFALSASATAFGAPTSSGHPTDNDLPPPKSPNLGDLAVPAFRSSSVPTSPDLNSPRLGNGHDEMAAFSGILPALSSPDDNGDRHFSMEGFRKAFPKLRMRMDGSIDDGAKDSIPQLPYVAASGHGKEEHVHEDSKQLKLLEIRANGSNAKQINTEYDLEKHGMEYENWVEKSQGKSTTRGLYIKPG